MSKSPVVVETKTLQDVAQKIGKVTLEKEMRREIKKLIKRGQKYKRARVGAARKLIKKYCPVISEQSARMEKRYRYEGKAKAFGSDPKNVRWKGFGTFGAASEVRHIDPSEWTGDIPE